MKTSLRRLITLSFFGVILVLMAILLAAFLRISQDLVIRSTTARLELMADLKADAVDHWLNDAQKSARLIAGKEEVQEYISSIRFSDDRAEITHSLNHLRSEMASIRQVFPYARSISLLEPADGRVFLSSDPALVGRVRRNEAYFDLGRQGFFTGRVAYSVGSESPVLYVSAPVHGQGELVAVVVVELSVADLDAIMDVPAGLEAGGSAYLVDEYGFYVTAPFGLVGYPMRKIAESDAVRRVLAGESGSGVYQDPRGRRVLGVYQWLPDAGMGLLVEVEAAVVTAEIRQTWLGIILFNLFLLVLVLAAARLLAVRLAAPLAGITRAAARLSQGDWNARAPVTGPDEIQRLAITFNDMAASVQNAQARLEDLVDQRTAELRHSNRQLSAEIAERARAEDQIKSALAEKETLLRELYHRTKNNMQIISALLDLQAGESGSPDVRRVMQEMQDRIRAMALVHQKLYQAGNLSRINLREYMADLAALLMQSYRVSPGRVTLRHEMEDVFILIDAAIPCGLILNELMSNVFKYAFPGNRPGEIRIGLRRGSEGEIEMEVSDNGVGLPPGFDWRQASTLGLSSVAQLSRQIGGRVELSSNGGVRCRVRFSEGRYTERI